MEAILAFLPPVVLLPVAVALVITAAIFRKRKAKDPKLAVASQLADMLEKSIVTRQRVDAAVEAVLTKVGVPKAIADWVGDVIAELTVKVPEWTTQAPVAEKAAIVARAYAATTDPTKVVEDYGGVIDADLAKEPAAVGVLTQEVIIRAGLVDQPR